jgi:hypothetical protein
MPCPRPQHNKWIFGTPKTEPQAEACGLNPARSLLKGPAAMAAEVKPFGRPT